MTDLAGISTFVAVAERGGFSAAARALGLSKSAVSKQIARLEERLGARLFNRTTRRLSLTEIGQAYFERCRRIIDEADEAEQAVTQLHAEPRGTLRISAPVSFGILHVARVLPGFMARYPDLHVDMELNDRRVDVIEEGLDLAIRVGDMAASTLVARRLGPCRFVVVASPGYWAEHGRPMHPSDLARHNCLKYVLRPRPGEFQFSPRSAPDETIAVTTQGRLVSNNGDLLMTAALAGGGVYICPTFFCAAPLADGRLQRALDDYILPETGIHAVWPPNRHLSAKVRAFVDYLVAAFGDDPAWDDAWHDA